MVTPIIVPINNTRIVDCIVQDGVRYCEKADITSQELGVILLGVSAIITYLIFLFWLADKVDHEGVIFAGIIVPLIIMGVVLL